MQSLFWPLSNHFMKFGTLFMKHPVYKAMDVVKVVNITKTLRDNIYCSGKIFK